MIPRLRVRTIRSLDSNITNNSLLMKLNPASARDEGASSTFTRLTTPSAPSASMSRFVNSPSPDHPDVSTSIRRWYRSDVRRRRMRDYRQMRRFRPQAKGQIPGATRPTRDAGARRRRSTVGAESCRGTPSLPWNRAQRGKVCYWDWDWDWDWGPGTGD